MSNLATKLKDGTFAIVGNADQLNISADMMENIGVNSADESAWSEDEDYTVFYDPQNRSFEFPPSERGVSFSCHDRCMEVLILEGHIKQPVYDYPSPEKYK